MVQYVQSVSEVLYTNIDQTLVNSLHGLLNYEIGGLDCCVITTEYITCPLYTHVTRILQCIVHVIYSVVSDQYSYTIQMFDKYHYNFTCIVLYINCEVSSYLQ